MASRAEYETARAAKRAKRQRGREACERGEHTKQLTWLHWRRSALRPANAASEMLLASGIVGGSNCFYINGKPQPPLGKYNGFCSRCGTAIAWASDRKAIGFCAAPSQETPSE